MIWRDTGGVGRGGKRFPAKGTLPALPRRQRMTASRAAAVSFNQDGGFSFFRAKERESPQKRERKLGLRIRRKRRRRPHLRCGKAPSYFAYHCRQPPPAMPTGRPCTFIGRVWFPTLRAFLKRCMSPQSAAQCLAVKGTMRSFFQDYSNLSLNPKPNLPSPLGRVPSRRERSGKGTT